MMSRKVVVRVTAVTAVVALLSGVALVTLTGHSRQARAASADVGAPTATIERRDISNTQDVDATLGFGDDRAVIARAAGILTAAPSAGKIVRPGGRLYALDGDPVILLDGAQPAFRDLGEGIPDGPDVRELEENLVRLGFDPQHLVQVDDHFSAATRAGIEALQRATGMQVTGSLPLGSVVFLPGERRITAVFVATGASVAQGAEILSSASTARIATITLDTSQRNLVAVGMPVSVVLPDSSITHGTVESVGATAATSQDQSSGAQSSTVSVAVAIRAHLSDPDGTPVTVRLTTETHRNVLSVPVTALLATSGGHRSLEVVEADASTRLVPVKTGLYAGGYVEVASPAIRAGMRVLDAPSS